MQTDKLTDNELKMTFFGGSSGITERDNDFPISGRICAIITQ
nr:MULTISPECIES: hypothetical protein [unclassified Allomuricauda]